MFDPYDYFRTGPPFFSAEDEQNFTFQERTFMQLMLMKNDYLTKTIWREQEYYSYVPSVTPVVVDDYFYFRKIDNAADCLSIYRKLAQGENIGEIPTEGLETVFSLKDLIKFYDQHAKFDEGIRTFCEQITESVKLGNHQNLIHSF